MLEFLVFLVIIILLPVAATVAFYTGLAAWLVWRYIAAVLFWVVAAVCYVIDSEANFGWAVFWLFVGVGFWISAQESSKREHGGT